jgi:hypothetical protein
MTRYFHHARIVALAGLALAISALAVAAAPAGAAVTCPPGVTNPAYCTQRKPEAVTKPATAVQTTEATLNGTVNGFGASAAYFFQYGRTRAYGFRTPTQTITGCPPGVTNPAYCVIGPIKVSALLNGLSPRTRYHFRLVALNGNGRSRGSDKRFTTLSVSPIRFVNAPDLVRHRGVFTVTVSLRTRADVTISLILKDNVVVEFFLGSRTGTFVQAIRAPAQQGRYVIRVVARAGGVIQRNSQGITVF